MGSGVLDKQAMTEASGRGMDVREATKPSTG